MRYSEAGKQMDLAPGEQELLNQSGHAFLIFPPPQGTFIYPNEA